MSASEVTSPTLRLPRGPEDATPGASDDFREHEDSEVTSARFDWELEIRACLEDADDPRLGDRARYASAKLALVNGADVSRALSVVEARPDSSASQFGPWLRVVRETRLTAGSLLGALDVLTIEREHEKVSLRRAALAVEEAYLWWRLQVNDTAQAALDRARSLEPGFSPAVVAAQLLAERQGDGARLLTVLNERLASAKTPEERAHALVRVALLTEPDPKRAEETLTLWLRALDEGPQTDVAVVARAGVARMAARLGRDADWSRALTLEVDASEPGLLRAASLSALASLQRYRLGTPEKATALLTRARTDDPSDWFLALALFEDQRAGRRWPRVLAILDELAPEVGAEDEDLAAAWFMEGAHVAEHELDDAVGAAARLRKVLALKPSDPVALQSLERLASRTGDLGLQTELAMGAVGRADDADERAALAVRAADFNCAALDDVEGALSFLRRALESVSAYGPAVHLFERLCPRTERWDELARMWEEIAFLDADEAEKASSDARARAEHLARLGRLYEEKTGDSARAIAAYRGWVETGVRRVGAFWALLRAAENAGDGLVAGEAALGLGTRCPALPSEARLAWCYRAATIFEEQAADDEAAIGAYEAALAIAPRFRPAWAGLARAHRRRKSFEGLASALVARAACEANASRAAALEVEAARVLENDLARPEKALEALERALGFDAHCVPAQWARARLLGELGRSEAAAEAFGRLAEQIRCKRARVAFWRRQAELLEWKLSRPAEALVPLGRARHESARKDGPRKDGAAPESAPPEGGLTPGWVSIQVTEERLLQILGRPVDVALATPDAWPDGKDSVGRLFVLALRLGDEHQAEALALLAHVAESEPDNGFAREIEASKRGPLGASRELAAALAGWAERCGDTDYRAGILRAALTVLHELDVDDEGCYPVAARLVEVFSDTDVAFTVDRLAARKREWPRVIAARRRSVETSPDDKTRAVALWDLAIARFEAGDRTGALAELGRSVELDVDYLPALRLRAFLEQQRSNAARAAALWERMGRLLRDPTRAADAWRRASRLHEDALSDVAAAGRCVEEILKLTPESDVDFRRLVALLDDEAGRKRLLVIARRRASLGEGAVRRERLYDLSQLLQAEDPSAAVEPLAEAAELDPSHMPTALALADLQEKLGRPAETVGVLVKVAGVAPGPEALVAIWKRVGRLAMERLDDPARAASAFENALLVDNQDPEAWEGLIAALNRQRHFAEAAACLRQLALTDPRPATRFDHFMALADLLEGALDDPEGAADAYEQALELEPGREDAHQALQKVLLRLDDPDRTARALSRYLGVFPQAAAERRRLAELLSGPLAQPARAAEEWRVLVTQNPGDRAARIALATTLERAGRDREAVAEHLSLLNLEALRLESIRALRRLFDRLGERRRAQYALGVLVALGAASPEEERAVREARLRFVPEPKAPLAPGDFDNIIRHPGESHPATALVVAMAEAVSKIFPGRLEDWGARPTDRLPPDDPARGLVSMVARAIGLESSFDIYVSPAGLAQVEAESLSPPALILPAHVLQTLPRQEAMLQIARWLGRIRAGTLAVARLPGKDLALVVAAALRTRDPNYGKGLVPEEALVETSQKIVRLLPRKQRRAFEQALAAVGKAPALEVERWRSALGHTAFRTAVAVSGDVVGAIENLVRQDRRLAAAAAVSAQDLWAAARKNVDVVQIVNFALGESLAVLQDRLGW